jgi:hypothetical protein
MLLTGRLYQLRRDLHITEKAGVFHELDVVGVTLLQVLLAGAGFRAFFATRPPACGKIRVVGVEINIVAQYKDVFKVT